MNKNNYTDYNYDNIMSDFSANKIEYLADLIRVAENLHIEDINNRKYNLNLNSEQLKVIVETYARRYLNSAEYEEFCDLCNELGC